MNCEGYKRLITSIETDERRAPKAHNYRAKLAWVLDRASHYAQKTGTRAEDILDAWEKRRDYWYMNYYQECNQPVITGNRMRVFDSMSQIALAVGNDGYRCPFCNGKSTNPYECNSGLSIKGKRCDWKVYGLFRDLGKGVQLFVKDGLQTDLIFMPIKWEYEYKPEVIMEVRP